MTKNKNHNKKKLPVFIVSFFLVFWFVFRSQPIAHAQYIDPLTSAESIIGDVEGGLDDAEGGVEDVEGGIADATDVGILTEQQINDLKQWAVEEAVNAAKKTAISMVQKKLTSSSKSKMITDYGKYLYTAPMQKTSTQMNAYYTAALGGTASSVNYEGAGGTSNYSAYLQAQAKGSIQGVNVKLTINNVVSDPTQPFSSGNMQGMVSLLECGNNPYCFSIASASENSQLFQQNQAVASAEQQNGYLPTKQNGVIVSPASVASNLATTASQMGANALTNVINNDTSAEDILSSATDFVSDLTDQVGDTSS